MRPLAFLQQMRERHGDVFALRLLGQEPLLVVADPELAKEVFNAPADVLRAGEGNRRVLGWLYGDSSLILLDGERHMSHRRLLLPALHGARLEQQAGAIRALAEAHLDAWPAQGEPLEVLPRLRELALDVIVGVVLGAGGDERLRPLRESLRELLFPAQDRRGDAPELRYAIRRVEGLIDAELAARREGSAPLGDDVLALLLEARGEDGSPLSDAEIRGELLTLIVAGSDTTAGALGWALERLARAPAALKRASEEAADGGGLYMDAVIFETLRMRPVVPMSARLVTRPFDLGGRSVPAGTTLAVSALLIHHRDDVYPEPELFRPERFLERQPGTYTWIPFGGGVRRCIGASFALMEMRVVLSTLLARTKLRAPDPKPEGARTRANTMVPAGGARVALERRRSRRWSDAAVWEGEGLRREVFFFPSSRGERLYGALYRAAVPARTDGIVFCPSWGVEADRSNKLVHDLAFATARLGAAAFVFHNPGYGDSEGDPAASTMESLTSAAVDAAEVAARRAPGLEWTLAGFTFGAAIACLAQRDCAADRLLLLQPELRPGSYFREIARKAERTGFGKDLERLAFGYPAPQAMLDGADEADAAVEAALAEFEGEGFAAAYEAPEQPDLLPQAFERAAVPGVWRFGSRKQPGLGEAALGWLSARPVAAGSGLR